ncbi:MAG: pyruvate kinase [Kiritimatiellia bacterium]|nr:pyruvate kinase [Kiritimatiellia bacterium]
MRKTKIVATIGPSSNSPERLRELIKAGADVFRLNMSHGTLEDHLKTIAKIRSAGKEVGREAAILQDLCGPKIRVGAMEDGAVELQTGREVIVTTEPVIGTSEMFSTKYEKLAQDVRPHDHILLDDGAITLEATRVEGNKIYCMVRNGGTLKDHKGMNLPGIKLSTPSVTQKDMNDLRAGLEAGVDFAALSFVRHPDDLKGVRRAIQTAGKTTQVIAKIEKPEALEHLDAIIQAADGLMVARGDLGVEMNIADVPMIQKKIIRQANERDKYVITATQMLESMTHNPMPTRAEVSDVANAIIDGTDGVMLSGETAVGKFPVEAVRMMNEIARQTEGYLDLNRPNWNWLRINPRHPVQDAIGHAASKIVDDLKISIVVAFTATGGTALFLSKSRPWAPIIAFTKTSEAYRRMRLFWGVEPVLVAEINNSADLRIKAQEYVRRNQLAPAGRRILFILGTNFGQIGATDALEIATVE